MKTTQENSPKDEQSTEQAAPVVTDLPPSDCPICESTETGYKALQSPVDAPTDTITEEPIAETEEERIAREAAEAEAKAAEEKRLADLLAQRWNEKRISSLLTSYTETATKANLSTLSEKARTMLSAAETLGMSIEEIPNIPEEIKTEISAYVSAKEDCKANEESLRSAYDSLRAQRDQIDAWLDRAQSALVRVSGKSEGVIKPEAKQSPTGARRRTRRGRGDFISAEEKGRTTALWLVDPAKVIAFHWNEEEYNSPSSDPNCWAECPECGQRTQGYGGTKQHVSKHRSAVKKGWVDWRSDAEIEAAGKQSA